MSSKAFDPPVYKSTYSSGLHSSRHSQKGDRILCCGIPCWLNILLWSVLLVIAIASGLYFYQRSTGKNIDLKRIR
jgi:hypothetical protein